MSIQKAFNMLITINAKKLVLSFPNPSMKKCSTAFLEVKKPNTFGFPGGPVVKNPPCNGGRRDTQVRSLMKIPHARETKPVCHY